VTVAQVSALLAAVAATAGSRGGSGLKASNAVGTGVHQQQLVDAHLHQRALGTDSLCYWHSSLLSNKCRPAGLCWDSYQPANLAPC